MKESQGVDYPLGPSKGTALPVRWTLASKSPERRDSVLFIAQFLVFMVALGNNIDVNKFWLLNKKKNGREVASICFY